MGSLIQIAIDGNMVSVPHHKLIEFLEKSGYNNQRSPEPDPDKPAEPQILPSVGVIGGGGGEKKYIDDPIQRYKINQNKLRELGKCIACLQCERYCPDMALIIDTKDD